MLSSAKACTFNIGRYEQLVLAHLSVVVPDWSTFKGDCEDQMA